MPCRPQARWGGGWGAAGVGSTSGQMETAWRRQIIATAFVAEALACLNRRNLSMAGTLWASANSSTHEGLPQDVQLDDEQIGELATAAALAYAVSKPLQSLLSDSISSRRQLSVSLVGTGVCNIALGLSSSPASLLPVMVLNGLMQGGVFPAIARLILVWYPEAVRGSYWSMVSIASNVGYGGLPVLVTMAMQRAASWRLAFVLPGVGAVLCGLLVPSLLRDSPQHAGLAPPADAFDSAAEPLLPAAGAAPRRLSCRARFAAVCSGRAALSLWLVAASIGCLFFVFRGLATCTPPASPTLLGTPLLTDACANDQGRWCGWWRLEG